jgi:hypothetical protein
LNEVHLNILDVLYQASLGLLEPGGHLLECSGYHSFNGLTDCLDRWRDRWLAGLANPKRVSASLAGHVEAGRFRDARCVHGGRGFGCLHVLFEDDELALHLEERSFGYHAERLNILEVGVVGIEGFAHRFREVLLHLLHCVLKDLVGALIVFSELVTTFIGFPQIVFGIVHALAQFDNGLLVLRLSIVDSAQDVKLRSDVAIDILHRCAHCVGLLDKHAQGTFDRIHAAVVRQESLVDLLERLVALGAKLARGADVGCHSRAVRGVEDHWRGGRSHIHFSQLAFAVGAAGLWRADPDCLFIG